MHDASVDLHYAVAGFDAQFVSEGKRVDRGDENSFLALCVDRIDRLE